VNSRIVFFTLISTFLLFALVVGASATTRMVGVSVGNKFRYSNIVSWNSTDLSAKPSSNLVEDNNTQWGEITVAGISGTNITVQSITHYKNGTEVTMDGWKDIDTGATNMSLFPIVVSANLTIGDSVYTSSSYASWIINETVSRTYSGVKRDTNHMNMPPSSGTQNSSYDFYWDKSTGFLVETLQENINHTGTYTTMWSEDFQIISSGVWTVPEFPAWTSALIVLIALTSAIIVIAGKRQPKRPLR
jgi:hypothetical protein